jgi:SM-20-related protein
VASRAPSAVALTSGEVMALGERGYFLRDGVLGSIAARAIHTAVEALASAGRLRPAGVSRGTTYRVDPATRGDRIAWLDPDDVPAELAGLWEWFLALRDALNRDAYLGLDRLEVQAARYPGDGAGYRRHRDAFTASPGTVSGRRVTTIFYANPAWRPEHGGLLRLHLPDGAVDVAPLLDRALVFLSERVEHEVLPTWAPRCAVTAWFRACTTLAA